MMQLFANLVASVEIAWRSVRRFDCNAMAMVPVIFKFGDDISRWLDVLLFVCRNL